ncbi:glycerophosphodiester phosphodiesterase, partial [Vibrio cholerae]
MLKPFSLSLLALACSTSLFSSIVSAEPLVIAHRGASGY